MFYLSAFSLKNSLKHISLTDGERRDICKCVLEVRRQVTL
jgi:hypothetical protein